MKLLFRQRVFSWFDSYDIFDEANRTVFQVKGELSWGHQLRVYSAEGEELGLVKEKVFAILPRFYIYKLQSGEEVYMGSIHKAFSFLPKFSMDYRDWFIKGDFFAWDYTIYDGSGKEVATLSKEIFHFSDHYLLDIKDPANALDVLLVMLAIDAEKCSSGDR